MTDNQSASLDISKRIAREIMKNPLTPEQEDEFMKFIHNLHANKDNSPNTPVTPEMMERYQEWHIQDLIRQAKEAEEYEKQFFAKKAMEKQNSL